MAKANSPAEGLASLIRNLEANTGKSIDAWIATARATGQTKHGQIVALLKKDHGLSHRYANQIALRAPAAAEPATPSDVIRSTSFQGVRPIQGVRPRNKSFRTIRSVQLLLQASQPPAKFRIGR
jgi:hypothetical protein